LKFIFYLPKFLPNQKLLETTIEITSKKLTANYEAFAFFFSQDAGGSNAIIVVPVNLSWSFHSIPN